MSQYGDEPRARFRRDSAYIYEDIRSHLLHAMPLLSTNYRGKTISIECVEDSSKVSPNLMFQTQQPVQKGFVESLHKKLSMLLMADYTNSKDRTNSVDMSDFPPLKIVRNILLAICFLSFFCAPLIYMPLGTIQAVYNEHCFLNTRINLSYTRYKISTDNKSSNVLYHATFEAVGTVWGPKLYCDFTTYVPVSIAIFSVFVGWSTFTIWPEMLSLGKGGVLMLIYMSFSAVSLGAAVTAAKIQDEGYAVTCRQLTLDAAADGLNTSCAELNRIQFSELEQVRSIIAKDVDAYMRLAQFAAWCLVGLAGTKVIISIYTFILTWFYARATTYMLEFDDDGSYSDVSINN